MNNFSDLEKRALEVFVTSSTDPIYACRHSISPEVFGAFGSFFSRNPKDLREHLLDAIYGRIKDHELEDSEEGERNLKMLAERKFNNPSEALAGGLSKSQEFFKFYYGQYSHKSIANTVWIPFVANDVSQLFARQLAYDQLAFFIEQSTRFVKFDVNNLFVDEDLIESKHADIYFDTSRDLAKAYEYFTEESARHYGKEIPFNLWLSKQNDEIKKWGETKQRAKYKRELKAKAFDVARLLLPQGVRTNIAWILDARSTEFDISSWKGHPLREIVEASKLIEKAGGDIAPSLLKYTEENPYYTDQYNGFKNYLDLPAQKIKKGVNIISHDSESLDKVVALLLSRKNRAIGFNAHIAYAKGLSFDEKINFLKEITEKRGSHDEWIDVEEAFDCLSVTAEIITDIGAARDLRRHQKWDRVEGIYTLDNGFYFPEQVQKMGKEASRIYKEAIEKVYDAEIKIRKNFPHQAQYIIPMAALHSLTMRGGLDQLQYMIETRSTPQGHFSYRQDAINLAEAFCKTHPWILGLKDYPEKKDFVSVYRDAPLKSLLRINMGETSLHH